MAKKVITEDFWDQEIDRMEKEDGGRTGFGVFSDPDVVNPTEHGTYIMRLLYTDGGNYFDDIKANFLRRYGLHWNLVQVEGKGGPVGCPKQTYGEECPVCEIADELIATNQVSRSDLYQSQSKWTVQSRWLIRALIVRFVPHQKGKVIEGLDEPIVRFFPLPWRLRTRLVDILKGEMHVGMMDEDEAKRVAREKLFDFQKGCLIRVSKGEHLDGWWSLDLTSDIYEIDGDYLDDSQWPDIGRVLPSVHTEHMNALLTKFRRDIPVLVAQGMERREAIALPSSDYKQVSTDGSEIDEKLNSI